MHHSYERSYRHIWGGHHTSAVFLLTRKIMQICVMVSIETIHIVTHLI